MRPAVCVSTYIAHPYIKAGIREYKAYKFSTIYATLTDKMQL